LAIVADSGAIFALYDRKDHHYKAVCRVLDKERSLVVIPSAVLGELDYLLREHLGIQAEIDFIESIMSGSFTLENLTSEDVTRCHERITMYRDLEPGTRRCRRDCHRGTPEHRSHSYRGPARFPRRAAEAGEAVQVAAGGFEMILGSNQETQAPGVGFHQPRRALRCARASSSF
jgi:hypothetical protein